MTGLVRPARPEDAQAMCDLINPIIAEGGTTAHRTRFTPERMMAHYLAPPHGISCKIAERGGRVLGFQALEWADPKWNGPDPLPADWALIASFVAATAQGAGVGRALFAATRAAAEAAGVVTIDATIRADNGPGLGFYAALGFVDYARLENLPLSDGTRVDRIRKRYDVAAQT